MCVCVYTRESRHLVLLLYMRAVDINVCCADYCDRETANVYGKNAGLRREYIAERAAYASVLCLMFPNNHAWRMGELCTRIALTIV